MGVCRVRQVAKWFKWSSSPATAMRSYVRAAPGPFPRRLNQDVRRTTPLQKFGTACDTPG